MECNDHIFKLQKFWFRQKCMQKKVPGAAICKPVTEFFFKKSLGSEFITCTIPNGVFPNHSCNLFIKAPGKWTHSLYKYKKIGLCDKGYESAGCEQ